MLSCKKCFALSILIARVSLGGFAQSGIGTVSPVSPVVPIAPVTPVMPVTDVSMPQMPSYSSSSSDLYKPGINPKAEKVQKTKVPQIPLTSDSSPENAISTQVNSINPTALKDLTASQLFNLVENNSLINLSELGFKQNKTALESPAIMRFVVNSNDILKSCNAIYFSDFEKDGSFLVTGDCKMLYDNKTLSETFYFYLQTKGTQDGHQVYDVKISVSQSSLNSKSVLYQLAQQKNITAIQTGNLVTIRTKQNNVNCDVLLDIGKKEK